MTSTIRLPFSVAAFSATLTAAPIPSEYITITGVFRFLAIVEGLAAKNEVMLDGFSDVITLDDMDCK